MRSGDRGALKHLPYFERLSTLDESSAEWRATSAGLVVLRLVDSWLEEGAEAVRGGWGTRAVREAIQAVSPGTPVGALLAGIVDAMVEAREVHPHTVTPRLLAYGQALALDAEYRLAADVYESIISMARPLEEHDLVTDAWLQLGAARRTLGDLEGAAQAYDGAREAATAGGDAGRVLRVSIADAKLAMERGNLRAAERGLEETILAARGDGDGETEALARHQLGIVAFQLGDFVRAITEIFAALRSLQSANARDRALGDIAAAFAELGCRAAARDAHLILAVTAQEQYARWMALINLLEIAWLDGHEIAFEQYRRELAPAALPPLLAVHFHLYSGRGLQRFGRLEQARRELATAEQIAERHRLNQLTFVVGEAIRALADASRIEIPVTAPPDAVASIVEELRVMRTLAER